MRIIHRISIASTPEIREELARMGFVVAADGLATFEIDESHEAWPRMQDWTARRKPLDIVSTTFSEIEINDAGWLVLAPDWHHGYPQPDELNFGYLQATYDLTDYCDKCGVGLRQRAPFQMKGEPKWGRNSVLQLNWVFGEYFVTPDVWEAVFKPYVIDRRAVTDRTGIELKTVVQLVVAQEVGVVTEGLASQKCPSCGRTKYLPVTRGPFPSLSREPTSSMAKTNEWFGSGASAHKGVLVSQPLARELRERKVRGASVEPVLPP